MLNKNIEIIYLDNQKIKEIKYIKTILKIYYEELPNNYPCKINDEIIFIINVKTGKIVDFPKTQPFLFQFKICDLGKYELLDENLNVLSRIIGHVPDGHSIPGKYGDYIYFDIKDGFIKNWDSIHARNFLEFKKDYYL